MYLLPVQPIIELIYTNKKSTIFNKKIEILVYKWIDSERSLSSQLGLINSSYSSASSLMNQFMNNRSKLSGDSVFDTLKNMWIMVTSAGKLIKDLKKDHEKLHSEFTYPEETSD